MTVLNTGTPENDQKKVESAPVSDQTIAQNPPENTPQNNPAKEPETSEDPNWRAFREARKKDRAEKEAAERRAAEKEAEAAALKAAMEAAFSKSAPPPQTYQSYYGVSQEPEETEEQRIEKKVNAILEQKERQYAQEQEAREKREYPARIARDFPDFNQVCSQEALDYLDFHYPEVSRPLQRLQDGYDKWHDIYHAVKKLIPNHSSARKEAMRADINTGKPKSMASPIQSPSTEKGRETWQDIEQRRAENWSRMQRARKGVS